MARTARQPDRPNWTSAARLLRCMAHPVRLTILAALARHSQCVKELNRLVPASQAQFSQHIAVLRQARLIACHANGPLRCYYVLRPTLVRRLIALLGREHPEHPRAKAAIVREVRRQARAAPPC